MDGMPIGNEENPQFYGQRTVEDSQNGLYAKSLQRQRILSAWTPGLLTLKFRGACHLNPRVKIGILTVSCVYTRKYECCPDLPSLFLSPVRTSHSPLETMGCPQDSHVPAETSQSHCLSHPKGTAGCPQDSHVPAQTSQSHCPSHPKVPRELQDALGTPLSHCSSHPKIPREILRNLVAQLNKQL